MLPTPEIYPQMGSNSPQMEACGNVSLAGNTGKECMGSSVGHQLMNGFRPIDLCRDKVGQIGQRYP